MGGIPWGGGGWRTGSNVVPFQGQYSITIPKKTIGHNQKGTTLEPLGIYMQLLVHEYVCSCPVHRSERTIKKPKRLGPRA